MSSLLDHTKILSNNLRDGQSSQRRYPSIGVRAVIFYIVRTALGCSLNTKALFKGFQMGQGVLSIVPLGLNRYYMLCEGCPPKAEVVSSNLAGCANLFNDLADAGTVLCCSMNSISAWSSRTN